MIDYYKLTDDVKSGIQAQYRNNTDEFARIKAENEALNKDRKRLEWLAINNARIWLQDGWYDIHDNGGTCIVSMKDNWRDAIDEAMEEK